MPSLHPVHLLQAILEVSWQGSIAIVLILAVRPLFGLRIPARLRYLLWTLVLLRLLLPALRLPPSPAGLQNIPAISHPIEQATLAFDRFNDGRAPAGAAQRGPQIDADAPAFVPPAPAPHLHSPIPWWKWAAGIWLTGVALFSLWIALAALRLYRLAADSVPVDPPIAQIWKLCCLRLTVRRPPRLLASRRVESPALVGLFRPALVIPARASLEARDWEHIFLHELAHCRRFDDWTLALQLLALGLHWFNPLVWFGFRCLRADRELAADEWALQQLSGRPPVAYADTLIKILSGISNSGPAPTAVGILEDRSSLKDRVKRIVSFGPRSLFGSLIGLAVLFLLAFVVLAKPAGNADLSGFAGLSPTQILVLAAHRGDEAIVKSVLEDGVAVDSVSDLPGEHTALASAAAANQMEIVRLLLVKGADVNLKPAEGDLAVIAAWKQGRTACGDYLLQKGAICDADLVAAAHGDTAAIRKVIADGKADAARLKLLADLAGANGHAETYLALVDGIQRIPDQAQWKPSDTAPIVAIARGHREVVEAMLQRGSQLNRYGWARLAAAAAQSPGMREWLGSKGYTVAEYSDGERLIDAVERDDLAEIRRLVTSGVDPNYLGKGKDDWTPLTRAAEGGHTRSVKLLLELGADPNTIRSPGWNWTPLALARNREIADLLFAAGANVNAKLFNRDVHIIDHCILYGRPDMVQWFIDHGVDVTKTRGDEPSWLFMAGKPEVAEILISHGIDVNAKDSSGYPALFRLEQMMQHPAKTVEVLLKHGADPNFRAPGGRTPLMSACDGETVDVLVAAGADLTAKDDQGVGIAAQYMPSANPTRMAALIRHGLKMTPSDFASLLINAIYGHRPQEVEGLLQMGIDPNVSQTEPTNGVEFSPLSTALGTGEFRIAAILRRAGAKDVSPLAEASAKGDIEQMKALIDAGANVNETGHGGPPLFLAIRRDEVAAVHLLLERGANINIFDNSGLTALGLAKMIGWNIPLNREWSADKKMTGQDARAAMDEIISLLSAQKADPNYRNEQGETALLAAANSGNTVAITVSIQADGNLNVRRADGMTPLMVAIASQPKDETRDGPGSVTSTDSQTHEETHHSRHGHFVRYLLDRKVELNVRNQAGQTALDLARASGNEEILTMLQQAGAKSGTEQ